MKVLQINCVYKKGSTGKITHDIHTELLKQGVESVVCYGRGEGITEDHIYKTCGELYSKINNLAARISGVMYGGCSFSTRKLIRIIKRENPDIVHLQCINGYFVNIYRLVEWLKVTRIRTVVTLHAEFMYTGGCGHSFDCNQWSTHQGCGHPKCPRWQAETKSLFFDRTSTMWKRMKKAFEGFDNRIIVTSVSPWLMNRAAASPIFSDKEHRVVLNGLDTSVFHKYETNELRKELGLTNEKIIFHATAGFNLNSQHIKGGYYVNELAKSLSEKNVKILVAGSYTEGIEVADNLILLGKIADQRKLAKLYALADVTILTSKRETFSMVTAESLCCGTPIVGFKAGAPEQIALKEYSSFVEYGDMDALERSVTEMLLRKFKTADIARSAFQSYGKDVMCERYIEIYEKLYSL